MNEPGISVALPVCSCLAAISFSRGTVQGAELGPTGMFLISRSNVLWNRQVPAACPGISVRVGAGHRPVPAEARAEQVWVLLLAVIGHEVHEQSLLG